MMLTAIIILYTMPVAFFVYIIDWCMAPVHEWGRWFAWYPVKVYNGWDDRGAIFEPAWLKFVLRRSNGKYDDGGWDAGMVYKFIPTAGAVDERGPRPTLSPIDAFD